VADESQLIVVAFVCFSVGVLTGVSLTYFFSQMTKLIESQPRCIEVETDETGVIKQLVRRV